MRKQRRRKAEREAADEPAVSPSRFHAKFSTSALAGLSLTLIALGLRFALPSRIAVEHFDAGVYASGAYFPDEFGGEYPARHYYAPPLLPTIVEPFVVISTLLGSEGEPWQPGPAIPVLFAGAFTVALIHRFATKNFSLTIGLSAGLLAATSDLHITLSREVLTDVPMLAFTVAAICLYAISGQRWGISDDGDDGDKANTSWTHTPMQSFGFAASAGAAAAVAWSFKYSGWLALAITAAGSAAYLIQFLITRQHSKVPRVAKPMLLLWLTMSMTACLLWSPVLLGLQDVGGYAVVAENHAGYVRGFSQWFSTADQQLANLAALQSPIGVLGFAASAVVIAGGTSLAVRFLVFAIGLGLACVVGVVPLAAAFAVVVVLQVVTSLLFSSDNANRRNSASKASISLPMWLLIGWFMGMTLATPIYHPYPRLALPWLAACWLLAPLGMKIVSDWIQTYAARNARFPSSTTVTCVGIAVCTLSVLVRPNVWTSWPAWDDRSQLAAVARKIATDVRPTGSTAIPTVFVYGEPALFFHLSATGQVAAWPIAGSLPEATDPNVYLVAGPHALDTEAFRQAIAQTSATSMEIVGQYAVRVSRQVALNRISPSEMTTDPNARRYEIVLYKLAKR
ncbi:MAG: hypothetical protein R3C05_27220 [Pirellulaceae bacterium]